MKRAIAAGAVYFLLIFLVGMALGTVRILLIEPRLGPVPSVLLEIEPSTSGAKRCALLHTNGGCGDIAKSDGHPGIADTMRPEIVDRFDNGGGPQGDVARAHRIFDLLG